MPQITKVQYSALASLLSAEACISCGWSGPQGMVQKGAYSQQQYSVIHYPLGRDDPIDSLQPVFGYFGGGGWAFGIIETDKARITADTYKSYMKAKDGDRLIIKRKIKYWDDSAYLAGDGKWSYRYESRTVIIGADIPKLSDLIPTDYLAFSHDWGLAEARESGTGFEGVTDKALYDRASKPLSRADFHGKTPSVAEDQALFERAKKYNKDFLQNEILNARPSIEKVYMGLDISPLFD